MSYQIRFRTCKDREAMMAPPEGEEYEYWATFADLSGRHLARSLTMVREHAARRPLRRIGGLSLEAKLEAEEENVRRSFAFARAELNS